LSRHLTPETARALATQVFSTLPSSRVLHVGADEPAFVEALVALGLDAWGYNLAPRIPSTCAPARFQNGSLVHAGHPDRAFSTVVWSIDADGHELSGADDLLPEVTRLCARHLVLLLGEAGDGAPSSANARHRIERLLFGCGFRKHPAQFLLAPHYEYVPASGPRAYVFERVPCEQPDRCGDVLRQSSASADVRALRYAFASQVIRRQHVVVDVGCGAGYGAAILYDSSSCTRVAAVDADAGALDYARRAYATQRPGLEFIESPPSTLDRIGDSSADVIVALDASAVSSTLDQLLRTVVRVLLPAGRLVIAVPARSAYAGSTVAAFVAQLERFVRVEQICGQFAPAEDREAQTVRGLMPFASAVEAGEYELDWWLVVGFKDPVTHQQPPPDQVDHPKAADSALDLHAAVAGYENPWLPYGMVMTGSRTTSRDVLLDLANRTLARAPHDSADRGAALCVLAYRVLERDAALIAQQLPLEQWLETFVAMSPRRPIDLRWCISNAYVLGCLYLQAGRFDEAERAFSRCAALDALEYRPLIATKTVDAAFWAGWLAHRRGDLTVAHDRWQLGMEAARRAVGEGWNACVGPRDSPIPYGLREARQVLAAADRCYQAIAWSHLGDVRIREFAELAFPGQVERTLLTYPAPAEPPSPIPPVDVPFIERYELVALLLRDVAERDIYLWGASMLGRRVAHLAAERFSRVRGFIDSQPEKAGTLFEGKPVHPPAVLRDAPPAARPFVIVTSRFAAEIRSSLEGWGYSTPDDFFVFPEWP
jgi:SAM-dependent methyltransferase